MRSNESKPTAVRQAMPLLGAAAGIALVIGCVHRIDTQALLEATRLALPWAPLLLALEGLRILSEAYATRLLIRSESIPLSLVVRLQLVSNACSAILPAGRLAGEALKVANFAPLVGSARATAIGVVNQVLSLLASGIVSLTAAAAALLLSPRREIAVALVVNASLLVAAAVFIQLAARGGWVQRLTRRFPRVRAAAANFQSAASLGSLVPLGPALVFIVGRLAQVMLFVVLFAALADRWNPLYALLAQGLTLVAATVADAVPAQMGATEYALMTAAPDLGISAATALSMALVFRAAQLFWAFTGALVAASFRPRASVVTS
ncbi:MAG TPA: lysylphosphatidylglycerol synthase domain-containing protein [Polyangiaceae bacterium]